MEQKKNLHKWIILLAVLVVLLIVLVTLLFTLGKPDGEGTPSWSQVVENLADQRSLLLKAGDSVQLNVQDAQNYTFSSSRPGSVTVDSSGKVTAVKKGNALITITCGEQSTHVGVIVDGTGSMIDVTKLAAKPIFSDILLHSHTDITGMAVDVKNNAIYFTQSYGPSAYNPLNSDTMITKVALLPDANGVKTWQRDSWMRFYGSGKGSIALDNDGETVRLWMESNGSFMGYGTTVSLTEWTDYGYGYDQYGSTFEMTGPTGTMMPSVDVDGDLVVVYDRGTKSYMLFDRSDMLGGNANPVYLHKFSCAGHQQPAAGVDESQGRYNASIRGFALYNGYLYQVSGSSSIYISVFDLQGNLQYCHRVTDYPELETRKPASIAIVDGKIYLAIASGDSTCYLANAWVFE